jgi:hypothetical protein
VNVTAVAVPSLTSALHRPPPQASSAVAFAVVTGVVGNVWVVHAPELQVTTPAP